MSGQYSEQIHNPIVESSLRQWREFDGLHRLTGTECPPCGAVFFPKRHVCPHCHTVNLPARRLSGRGVVINMDKQFLPPVRLMGFSVELDRTLALVRMVDGPVVVAEIVDLGETQLRLGDTVRMVTRRIARSGNGDYRYAFKFVVDPTGMVA